MARMRLSRSLALLGVPASVAEATRSDRVWVAETMVSWPASRCGGRGQTERVGFIRGGPGRGPGHGARQDGLVADVHSTPARTKRGTTSSPTDCSEHHIPRGRDPKTACCLAIPSRFAPRHPPVSKAPSGRMASPAPTRAESVLVRSGRMLEYGPRVEISICPRAAAAYAGMILPRMSFCTGRAPACPLPGSPGRAGPR